MEKLTDKQAAVLQLIKDAIVAHGVPPTLREIGTALGLRSINGVVDHLHALERKGYIVRGNKSRCIRIVGVSNASAQAELVVRDRLMVELRDALARSLGKFNVTALRVGGGHVGNFKEELMTEVVRSMGRVSGQ